MDYTHLGRSGLTVSRLSLGTMNFAMTTDGAGSVRVLDAAVEAGITLIDTADAYGGPQSPDMAQGHGVGEEIIGRWLAAGGHRDQIVLATKAYQPMGLGPNDRGLSAYHLRRACDASLKRLQTDHIDLFQKLGSSRTARWPEDSSPAHSSEPTPDGGATPPDKPKSSAAVRNSTPTRRCAGNSANTHPMSLWLGSSTIRSSARSSLVPALPNSSPAACVPWRSTSPTTP